MYYDIKNDKKIIIKESSALKFLYNTLIGRLLLKIFTTKFVANTYAKYMNSKLSKRKINKFILKNNINMDDYEEKDYTSFNDFFMRNVKSGKRKIEDGLFAICDSKLSVYKIDENSKFNIKNSIYTVEELIDEKRDYKYALIFRLCVDDYHHYIFPDSGKVINSKYINGKLHTVQPIALKKYKVFHENSRQVTFLDCDNLGDVCIIEVGALIVGKIVNEDVKSFKRGDEKGHFEFGGSTVIMLLNKDIEINEKIIEMSNNDIETIVRMGQNIGR
ncbi:MAG: phosphatidylserine decarboxylase [Firmicutes bacterium]|nr:phosphatidylserine decarboxylase [Bacillota bacterium]